MSEDHNSKGKFKKGNKAGARSKRNKGIVAHIKSISTDLQDYINILDSIVRDPKTKVNDKISAIKELLDRSMGKSIMAIHQTGDLDIVIKAPEDLDDNI